MNTNLLKETDNPNSTLSGLIANLTAMQNDRVWHEALGVGSFSYAEGIKDAIEAISEYKAIAAPVRRVLRKGVKNGS